MLSLLFARRYLFSRKSLSIINIISGISSFTVAIPVMAMVVLLSVFNGFDSLIRSMYQNFDPDIRISAADGRFFDSDSLDTSALLSTGAVQRLGFVMEENVMLEYRGRQMIGAAMGVDSLYGEIVPIAGMITRGKYSLAQGDLDQTVVGRGVAYRLGVGVDFVDPLTVYVPRRGRASSVLPVDIYRQMSAFPSGTYALDGETDSKYIIVPIGFMRELLEYGEGMVSAAVIKLNEGTDPAKARNTMAELLGESYKVQTRYQQKEELYVVMQYEKWGIYIIILMVLIIASFSVVGSLAMMIIDKRKDAATLVTLGADRGFIRRIFLTEGMLVCGVGMAAGLVVGLAVCLLQQHFGWVRMAGSSFLVEAYPVEIKFTDILGIVTSVGAIGFAISWLTVREMIKR